MPEIDPRRTGTRINLGMIVAVALFLALMFVAVLYYRSRYGEAGSAPPPPEARLNAPVPALALLGTPTAG